MAAGEFRRVARIRNQVGSVATIIHGLRLGETDEGVFGSYRVSLGTRIARWIYTVPSYAQATDPELIGWSAGGDRRAFDEIVTRHGLFALRLAARLIPDRSAAEDIAQEALVRAWAQAARFDPRRAQFTTWLYRIVTNLCVDHRRRRWPESMPEDFDPIDPAAGAQDMLESDERDLAIARALRDLPARQRAAMALVYDEGLSGIEAARVLGLSVKAVERLLARARASVRNHLQSRDGLKGAEDVDA